MLCHGFWLLASVSGLTIAYSLCVHLCEKEIEEEVFFFVLFFQTTDDNTGFQLKYVCARLME